MGWFERIRKTSKINLAYSLWEDYREKLTEQIIEVSKGSESIVIVGAGYSNDIDLALINECYKEITLLDIDVDSMKEACKQYGLEENQVDIYQYNLTGINDQDYILFEKLLSENATALDITLFIDNLKKKILYYNSDFMREYDVCVCCGVHSQLVVMFANLLYVYRNNYNIDDRNIIIDSIKEISQAACRKLNDFMLEVANIIVIGYEYTTLLMNDKYFAKDKLIIELIRSGRLGSLEDFNVSRVEGALQCEMDINEKQRSGIMELVKWDLICWQFLKEKKFLVNVLVLVNTKKELIDNDNY